MNKKIATKQNTQCPFGTVRNIELIKTKTIAISSWYTGYPMWDIFLKLLVRRI